MATFAGQLTEMGNVSTVAAAFEYGEAGAGTPQETLAKTLDSTGSYEIAVDGLDPETTYEVRAVAATDNDRATGDVVSFTTDPVPLTVETTGVTEVGERDATVGGAVTALGDADEATAAVEVWRPRVDERRTVGEQRLGGPGEFETRVAGLEPDTTYRARAVAETAVETAGGEIQEFTTEALPLTVETTGVTDVGSTGATVQGAVPALGEASAVTVVVEYGPVRGGDRQETRPQSRHREPSGSNSTG